MPELSVIIATYNRAERLRRCLDALRNQTLAPGSFEVVVVVDGSTDDTLQMLGSYDAPYRLRTIYQCNSGQAVALNRGIEEARGRICLFLDDDIIVSTGCLAEHLKAQQTGDAIVGVGQLTLSVPDNADWYARAFEYGWRQHYSALNAGAMQLTWEDCYGGNLSAPRQLVQNCGGFDASLPRGFDVELAYRLEKLGCVLTYLPAAIACQDQSKGFGGLSKDTIAAGAAMFELSARRGGPRSVALDSLKSGHPIKVHLTRMMLTLRIPPRLLACLGVLIPSRRYQYVLHRLVHNVCFWQGVYRAARAAGLRQEIRGRLP
jgi:GT2 family glycosyltransferase